MEEGKGTRDDETFADEIIYGSDRLRDENRKIGEEIWIYFPPFPAEQQIIVIPMAAPKKE